MNTPDIDLGEVAYCAFRQFKNDYSDDQNPWPEWRDLREHVRKAWRESAAAVVDEIEKETGTISAN